MINTWSDLFAAIKIWWHTPISLKIKIEKKPEPTYKTEDLLKPISTDLMETRLYDTWNSYSSPNNIHERMIEADRWRRKMELHISEINESLEGLPDSPPEEDKHE